MAQQSKIELLLQLKDRLSTGISRAKANVSKSTDEMRSKINRLKQTHIEAFSRMKESVPGLSRAIDLLKNPITGIIAAVGALGFAWHKFTGYLHQAEQASNVQAVAESRLAHVMQTTMSATSSQIQNIKDLVTEQQRLGVIGDEIQLSGAQELATYLTKESSLKKLLPVMNDMLAQQYGLNATQESAVNIASMMGKVMDGQVGALSRYGYKFSEAQAQILKYGNESKRAAVLADVVSSAVGGMNEALASTPEGQFQQLANDMSDLDEQMGKMFVNIKMSMFPLYQFIYELKSRIVTFFEENQARIQTFMSSVATFAKGFINGIISVFKGIYSVVSFLYSWREVLLAVAFGFAVLNYQTILAGISVTALGVKTALLTAKQWLLNIAMNANPIGIIITLIGLLIGFIVALCRKYEGWATVWNAVKTFLVNSFKQYVASWKFGFQEIWFEIQIIWKRLQSFGQFVSQLFQNIGKAIKAALSGNFSEAKQLLTSKITTDASKEIDRLKQEREANRKKFANETTQRIKQTKEAFGSISLTKTSDAKEDTATNPFTTQTFGDMPATNASNGTFSSSSDATSSVVGSAKQIRNITINIDSFIKGGINTHNTEMQHMQGSEIASYLEDLLNRVIRNVEMSY